MRKTRIVLNGHAKVFSWLSVPIHFTVDIPDGAEVPVHIPALHFDGTASATQLPDPNQPALIEGSH